MRAWTNSSKDWTTGITTITMKRCCNGCGRPLGDVIESDIDDNCNLTDVRDECGCNQLLEAL